MNKVKNNNQIKRIQNKKFQKKIIRIKPKPKKINKMNIKSWKRRKDTMRK